VAPHRRRNADRRSASGAAGDFVFLAFVTPPQNLLVVVRAGVLRKFCGKFLETDGATFDC
jgi:hypothetical protein